MAGGRETGWRGGGGSGKGGREGCMHAVGVSVGIAATYGKKKKKKGKRLKNKKKKEKKVEKTHSDNV